MGAVQRVSAFLDHPTVQFWGAVASTIAGIASWFASGSWGDYATPAFFVITVGFLGRLAWNKHSEAEAHRQAQAPKFEIVFLPQNDTDSRPYLQELTFPGVTEGGQPAVFRDRRYRVGIRNLSTSVVPAVHVILAHCDPGGNHIHVGHRLQVMDSDPRDGERDLHPHPQHEPTLFFDVVNEIAKVHKQPNHIRFCFQNENLCQPIDVSDRWNITLRAEGGGWTHEADFAIEKAWLADQQKRHKLIMKTR